MSDFYRKLDEAEIRGRAERLVGNLPENLHDYQGYKNSDAVGIDPCGPGPYKWFRCQNCGYSGEITEAEITKHRDACATGITEPTQPPAGYVSLDAVEKALLEIGARETATMLSRKIIYELRWRMKRAGGKTVTDAEMKVEAILGKAAAEVIAVLKGGKQ